MRKLNPATSVNKTTAIGLLVFTLLALASCKTTRVTQNDRNLPNRKASDLIDSLAANELQCTWVSIKYGVSFKTAKNSDSFKMYLRMRKDSAIWVSATYYAVEVARFLFTPDSVKYIDRRNNKYYIGNYDYITQQFQVDANFELIQSLVLANSIGIEKDTKERVRTSKDDGMYFLSFLRRGQYRRALRRDELRKPIDLAVNLWIEPEHFRVGKLTVTDFEANRTLTASYDEFEPSCNSRFPKEVTYLIDNANEQLEVKTSVLKLSTNKKVSLSFTIPSQYEPLVP